MNIELIKTIILCVTTVTTGATAYHQFIRFRGAKLVPLDRSGTEPQTSIVLKYPDLPSEIRNQYPDYRDPRGCHAIVRIPFANEGDRAGYVKFLRVNLPDGILQGTDMNARVRCSFYTYCVVPAFGIGLHTLLLRNLPLQTDTKIKLEIDMELGRAHPFSRKPDTKLERCYVVEVLLKAPSPELMQTQTTT
jgi:hypothetical protein